MQAGIDELDIAEADHAAWVKAQRDPALWHQAAMAVLAYRDDDHGFLPWLLQQPEMDRATAGWIFLWPEGSLYLRGETDFPLNHISSEGMVALFRALCERSESTGFSRDGGERMPAPLVRALGHAYRRRRAAGRPRRGPRPQAPAAGPRR